MSGQSVVTIAGRDYYLGPPDSPGSIARYGGLILLYQQGGLTLPEGFEIESLDPQVAMMLGGIPTMATSQQDEPIRVGHITAAYGKHAKLKYASSHAEKAHKWAEQQRHTLRHETNGIKKVIARAAQQKRRCGLKGTKKDFAPALNYLKKYKAHMDYAERKKRGDPIGSGIT